MTREVLSSNFTDLDEEERAMKRATSKIVMCAAATAMSFSAMPASARGIMKGAAKGAVVGHVLGHHAKVGAAIGAVHGHHRAARRAH